MSKVADRSGEDLALDALAWHGPVFRHFRLSFAVILIPLHVCALLFADEAAPTPVNDAVIFSALIALPLAALYTFVMYPIVELSTMRIATILWTAKATVAGFGFYGGGQRGVVWRRLGRCPRRHRLTANSLLIAKTGTEEQPNARQCDT